MGVRIRTQFAAELSCSVVKSWKHERSGPIVTICAVHVTGATRAVALTHTYVEADAVLERIMSIHEKSGDEVVTLSAREIVMDVRRAARTKI